MTFSSKVLDECQRHGRTEERSKLNRKASEGETELVQVDKPLEPNLLQIRKTSARAKTKMHHGTQNEQVQTTKTKSQSHRKSKGTATHSRYYIDIYNDIIIY